VYQVGSIYKRLYKDAWSTNHTDSQMSEKCVWW